MRWCPVTNIGSCRVRDKSCWLPSLTTSTIFPIQKPHRFNKNPPSQPLDLPTTNYCNSFGWQWIEPITSSTPVSKKKKKVLSSPKFCFFRKPWKKSKSKKNSLFLEKNRIPSCLVPFLLLLFFVPTASLAATCSPEKKDGRRWIVTRPGVTGSQALLISSVKTQPPKKTHLVNFDEFCWSLNSFYLIMYRMRTKKNPHMWDFSVLDSGSSSPGQADPNPRDLGGHSMVRLTWHSWLCNLVL